MHPTIKALTCAALLPLSLLVSTAIAQAPDAGATPPIAKSEGAGAAAEGRRFVIQPGQEELIAEMVGKGETLPGGCTLTSGQIEYVTVKATYACAGGEVVLELAHPSEAGRGATTTDRFAVAALSGSPPPALVDAIAARIRAREARFQWKDLGPPRRSAGRRLAAVGVALVAVVLALILWRRYAARRAQ